MHIIEESIQNGESIGNIAHTTFNKVIDKIIVDEWRRIFIIMNEKRRKF